MYDRNCDTGPESLGRASYSSERQNQQPAPNSVQFEFRTVRSFAVVSRARVEVSQHRRRRTANLRQELEAERALRHERDAAIFGFDQVRWATTWNTLGMS